MPKLVIFYYYAVFEDWNVSISTYIVMPGSYIYIFEDWNVSISAYIVMPGSYIYI